MSAELAEIRDFLARLPLFAGLDDVTLERLCRRLEIRYRRRDSTLPMGDEDRFTLLRTGAVESRLADGALLARIAEGEWIHPGRASAIRGSDVVHTCIEDSLLYQWPVAEIDRLREQSPWARQALLEPGARRLLESVERQRLSDDDALSAMALPLADLLHRSAVSIGPGASIQEAAIRMSEARVSSLVVVDSAEAPIGIVTDRDLRLKVIAQGRDSSRRVREIMTSEPVVIDSRSPAHEALAILARYGIHHLPVVDTDAGTTRLRGVITRSAFIESRNRLGLELADRIHAAHSLGELDSVTTDLLSLRNELVRSSVPVRACLRVIAGLADTLLLKLISLAHAGIDAIGSTWCLCVQGALARHEAVRPYPVPVLMIASDDISQAERHRLDELLAFLGRCEHCRDVNPSGVLTLTEWRRALAASATDPLLTDTLADARCLYGNEVTLRRLQGALLGARSRFESMQKQVFTELGKLVAPLGFFRDQLLYRDGHTEATVDIATRGLQPIDTLVRWHTLSNAQPMTAELDAGPWPISTRERIEFARESTTLDESVATLLQAALDRLLSIRLAHDVGAENDVEIIEVAHLSAVERRHLHDAFLVIDDVIGRLDQHVALTASRP